MWRSFDRRECMKRRVYLEIDYQGIPKDTLDSFSEEMLEYYNTGFCCFNFSWADHWSRISLPQNKHNKFY